MATPNDTQFGLTDEQVRQYHETGFLRFDALIHGEKLARYKAIFDELTARGSSLTESKPHFALQYDEAGAIIPGMLHKIQGVCVADRRVLDLAREPVILDKIVSLVGPNLDVFGTKFFPVMPDGGTSTSWHQDNFSFGTKSDGNRANDGEIVTCGIYLENADVENGCLRVVPRSHLSAKIVTHTHSPGAHGYGSWADVDESQALDIECPGGTVILFSANLLHAANRNVSERTRYSTAWHYILGDLDLTQFRRGEYDDRHIVRGN